MRSTSCGGVPPFGHTSCSTGSPRPLSWWTQCSWLCVTACVRSPSSTSTTTPPWCSSVTTPTTTTLYHPSHSSLPSMPSSTSCFISTMPSQHTIHPQLPAGNSDSRSYRSCSFSLTLCSQGTDTCTTGSAFIPWSTEWWWQVSSLTSTIMPISVLVNLVLTRMERSRNQ